jgi:hypothetical protein
VKTLLVLREAQQSTAPAVVSSGVDTREIVGTRCGHEALAGSRLCPHCGTSLVANLCAQFRAPLSLDASACASYGTPIRPDSDAR